METKTFPAVWMRGGTSKGLFINPAHLPKNQVERDNLLLAAIGSPDPYGKQIDGLGGATSSTSKIVLIAPSVKYDFDIDYTFGHVAIDQPVIDYSGNCGNLSAAVGVYAVEHGLVKISPRGVTKVRVWQTNLSQKMVIHVTTSPGGCVIHSGTHKMAGIPRSGAPIKVEFVQPGGKDGSVLPTGQTTDVLNLENGEQITASLINAGNATVFVTAESLGLQGTELPDEINQNPTLLIKVEQIRRAGAVMMGLANSIDQARVQPATPKLAFIAKAQPSITTDSASLGVTEIDLCARIFSMGKLHHAYTGTGAIATAVAAAIPGTLVAGIMDKPYECNTDLRIGHSAGLMECNASVENLKGNWIARNASYLRTARTLMRGEVVIPEYYLQQ